LALNGMTSKGTGVRGARFLPSMARKASMRELGRDLTGGIHHGQRLEKGRNKGPNIRLHP
ncbi:hypothetical protein O6379_23835, partial [Salmonella enterica subsp. enterica]|nr:hypothetical protein [Salmonella enterica]